MREYDITKLSEVFIPTITRIHCHGKVRTVY